MEETQQVICNDGTTDTICVKNCPQTLVAVPPPCENNGGVNQAATDAIGEPAPDEPAPAPANQDLTSTQKWGLVVGLTLVAYFILYKAGSLK